MHKKVSFDEKNNLAIDNSSFRNYSTRSADQLSAWFSDNLRPIVYRGIKNTLKDIEEIRLRIFQPVVIRTVDTDYFLGKNILERCSEKCYLVTKEDLSQTVERMTFSSIYAAEEELRQGFITLPGGHRVGIAGEIVIRNGKVQSIKHISAINFRITRQPENISLHLLGLLFNEKKIFCNTLIVSAPRAGKTTVLRMLIKQLSNGTGKVGFEGMTVGVIDERGEIAGMWQGIPSFDLGCRTDVLDRSPKPEGLLMMIRAMSPEVVAMDELGSTEDVSAILEAVRCGVKILATAHADSLAEIKNRPTFKALFKSEVFERVVILSRRKGPGTLEKVYNLRSQKELHLCSDIKN